MKIFFILFLFIFSREIFSIPSFARNYSVNCSFCHTIPPDLNKKGNEFILNGFYLEKEDLEKNKKLNNILPISLQMKGFALYRDHWKQSAETPDEDFQTPYELSLCPGVLFTRIFLIIFHIPMKMKDQITMERKESMSSS